MKLAVMFPGQGTQKPGMGKDFYDNFRTARDVFAEADDALSENFSRLMFEGAQSELTITKNAQLAILICSFALLKVVEKEFPHLIPSSSLGLSLGEYTALAAAGVFTFADALRIVKVRGTEMAKAAEERPGTMACVLGLSAEAVEALCQELVIPEELAAANFNCPGQVVISGTFRGVELGSLKAKELGAKRVLPLEVSGAFHSKLMEGAEEALSEVINNTPFKKGRCPVVMNVPGTSVVDPVLMKQYLIQQLTGAVRWEQGVKTLLDTELFLELGPGKTLAGFNKRIGVEGKTISIETVENLKELEV